MKIMVRLIVGAVILITASLAVLYWDFRSVQQELIYQQRIKFLDKQDEIDDDRERAAYECLSRDAYNRAVDRIDQRRAERRAERHRLGYY